LCMGKVQNIKYKLKLLRYDKSCVYNNWSQRLRGIEADGIV